jgi:hypothetical protein
MSSVRIASSISRMTSSDTAEPHAVAGKERPYIPYSSALDLWSALAVRRLSEASGTSSSTVPTGRHGGTRTRSDPCVLAPTQLQGSLIDFDNFAKYLQYYTNKRPPLPPFIKHSSHKMKLWLPRPRPTGGIVRPVRVANHGPRTRMTFCL